MKTLISVCMCMLACGGTPVNSNVELESTTSLDAATSNRIESPTHNDMGGCGAVHMTTIMVNGQLTFVPQLTICGIGPMIDKGDPWLDKGDPGKIKEYHVQEKTQKQ